MVKKSSINPGIKKIFKSEKSDRDKADSSLNIVQMDKSLATPTDFGIKDSDPIFPAEREIAKKIYNALLDARKKGENVYYELPTYNYFDSPDCEVPDGYGKFNYQVSAIKLYSTDVTTYENLYETMWNYHLRCMKSREAIRDDIKWWKKGREENQSLLR